MEIPGSADYQRISLLLELVSVADVIRWADDQIVRSELPEYDLVQISLGRKRSTSEIAQLLGSVSLERGEPSAFQAVLAHVGQLVRDDALTTDNAVVNVFKFLQANPHADDSIYYSFMCLDEDAYLIRGGVNILDLRERLLERIDAICAT